MYEVTGERSALSPESLKPCMCYLNFLYRKPVSSFHVVIFYKGDELEGKICDF
jgi:hypothetical protein